MTSPGPVPPSPTRITPLSRPTSTLLRSCLVAPTLPSILSELLHNSLAASPSRIDVHLCVRGPDKWLRVEDDGVGMTAEGLAAVGRRGMSGGNTSNLTARTGSVGGVEGTGRGSVQRGEALSSIAALSTLELSTRHRDDTTRADGGEGASPASPPVRTKIIKASRVLFHGTSDRPVPQGGGTVVLVKDIFHNVPVRRAQMDRASGAGLVGACKKVVEELALVWSHVRWTVWDEPAAAADTGEPRRILSLSLAGTKNSLEAFRAMYGTAGVETVQNIRVLTTIPTTACVIRADGFISLGGSLSRSHQHLYCGSRLLPLERGGLHALVAHKFKHSRFSAMAADEDPSLQAAAGRSGGGSGVGRSPRRRRGAERHPIYVLDISVSDSASRQGMETGQYQYQDRGGGLAPEWESRVQVFLGAVVDEFLKRHGFVSDQTEDSPGGVPEPIRRSAARQDNEGRTRSAPPVLLDLPLARTLTPRRAFDRLAARPSSALRNEAADLAAPRRGPTPVTRLADAPRPSTPLTQIVIDPRTGRRRIQPGSVRQGPTPQVREELEGGRETPEPTYNRRLFASDPRVPLRRLSISPAVRGEMMLAHARGTKRKHQWIEDLMDEVGGDVLPVQLARGKSAGQAHTASTCQHCSPGGRDHSDGAAGELVLRTQLPSAPVEDITLPALALASARVLGQVDLKYVACVLPTSDGADPARALVMIDQHAADERVSVEAILRELCEGFRDDAVPVTVLTKSQPRILLTQEEATTLDESDVLALFGRWGVRLSLPEDGKREGPYVQVTVGGVPTALVHRLGRQDAAEMTRLVRLYLPVLAEGKAELRSLLTLAEAQEVDYERFVRWMPGEMLELANSKACRNAIMFQDTLSLDQCTRLIGRLGETRKPFICAHGRPSLVPLVLLPSAGPFKASDEERPTKEPREIDWARWANSHRSQVAGQV